MKAMELAHRYAKSIFELTPTGAEQENTLEQLRLLAQEFGTAPEIAEFLSSPLVKLEDREKVIATAAKNANVRENVLQLLFLLARNNRFGFFQNIVEAFQGLVDSANGVIRGTVRSASSLGPAERQQIESIVEKVLKKKVIMTYKTDPAVIGGLVAKVGSYTFDDSLDSHLTRLNEELKRRAL
ncbi:MAG: ATP synthase F1 subunit delta [Bdellovibrionaceae bacterium]|nr:ATP synthase F1 subunit delta [Pseudobdellovibrionaceae bacterium]